jgi:hypothetical protein
VIATTEAELKEALASGSLQEGEHLDFKRELSVGERANRDMAIDIASKAVSGGDLIIGIDEGRPPKLTPVDLRGLRERIEQIARQGIDPAVRIEVREIVSDEGGGYIHVHVPESPDAPHAVEGVFRARAGSTNTRLSAAEVRQLLRSAKQIDVTDVVVSELRSYIVRDPTPPDLRTLGHMFVVALPRDGRPEMLQEAVGHDWERWTRAEVLGSAGRLTAEWSPDLGRANVLARVPDGWVATSYERPHDVGSRFYEPSGLELEFDEDGSVRLFCSRATDMHPKGMVVFELIVGGLVYRVAGAVCAVSQATGYAGIWDCGLAVVGLKGCVSYFRLNNWWVDCAELAPYPNDEYVRVASLTSPEISQQADLLVERLVGPLNRTLSDGKAAMPTSPHSSDAAAS